MVAIGGFSGARRPAPGKPVKGNAMKKWITLAVSFLLAISFIGDSRAEEDQKPAEESAFRVALAYGKTNLEKFSHVLEAYKSVLHEEGVPVEVIDSESLLAKSPARFAKNAPVLIFPDDVATVVPGALASWADKYLEAGGNVAVIFNAGVMNRDKAFLDRAVFADITGVNYITYTKRQDKAYSMGVVQFRDEAARDQFEIPMGKALNGVLTNYMTGPLEYITARVDATKDLKDSEIYAYVIPKNDQQRFPGIVVRNVRKGKVVYVNVPLGYHKAYGDDLPMRAVLREFLFREIGIPHLCNTPSAKGGLVINWHIDAGYEIENVPELIKKGFFPTDLPTSLHVTAGPDNNKIGDGEGIEACGKGKKLVEQIMPLGEVASHGGWTHNWLCEKAFANDLTDEEFQELVQKNNRCIKSLTGKPLYEYSSPCGIFHQPVASRLMEKEGIIAYYYTGDIGSAPNRTFFDSKMTSDRVIAFPVMPYGKAASLSELDDAKISKEEIIKWLYDYPEYVIRNKTIRMFYSHPNDLTSGETAKLQPAFLEWLAHLKKLQSEGKLLVRPMRYFADFLLRFYATKYRFSLQDDSGRIALSNPKGLKDISVAIPKSKFQKPDDAGLRVVEDDRYYYAVIQDDIPEKTIHFEGLESR